MVPAMHSGDNYSMLFEREGATVMVSGKQIGTITPPQLAEAMWRRSSAPNQLHRGSSVNCSEVMDEYHADFVGQWSAVL